MDTRPRPSRKKFSAAGTSWPKGASGCSAATAGPTTSALAVWIMWWLCGEDVNVFVVDTEVYSNTGGQSLQGHAPGRGGSVLPRLAKRAAKKDLGAIMMTYDNVYVAQVAMGADPQPVNSRHPGGGGLPWPVGDCGLCPLRRPRYPERAWAMAQQEMKRAVEAGYWTLYRYNPNNQEAPLTLDCKTPTMPFEEFLDGEVRYASPQADVPGQCGGVFLPGRAAGPGPV